MDTRDLYRLPDGVTLPRKYRKTVKAQTWYIEGAHDGAKGKRFFCTEEDKRDLIRHQGLAAWVAYNEGYDAAERVRLQKAGSAGQ